MIDFIQVGFLHVIVECLLYDVINKKKPQNNHCRYSNSYCESKYRVFENRIVVELANTILFDNVSSDKTQHTYSKLAVHDNIYKGDACSWRERITDNRHKTHIYNHQSSYVSDFIIKIWSLNESEQS